MPRLIRSILSLAVPLALVSSPAIAEESGGEDWGAFGIQTQWIDEATRPGEDFDRYVNGGWNDVVEIPEDKIRIGTFIELRDLSDERIRGILEELAAAELPAGSDEARIAAAYTAFMDTETIETKGLEPLRPYLQRIFAARTTRDLGKLFSAPGYATPIDIWVDPDEKDSDRYALSMGQGGLGLPDRDYYLKDSEKNREIRAGYVALLAEMLGHAGYSDPESAAQAVWSLELRMAQEMWDRAAGRNRDLTYDKIAVADAEALGPDGLVRTMLDEAGLGAASEIIVTEMPPTDAELAGAGIDAAQAEVLFGGGVPATLALVEDVPIATWQAYLAAHFLMDNAGFLPREIDEANFAFFGKVLGGQQQQQPRWKRGVDAVESQLGELLGKIYAERYYPPEQKAEMESLVANLRKAMAANLHELEWMGPETREEALRKLDSFRPKIGAPDKFKQYEGQAVASDDPLGNRIAAIAWGLDFMAGRLGKQVDLDEWLMFPQTVNAYYHPILNEIVFPAAILQPPFFNLSADAAVNYGAIGAVIGHEIGHGFDDQGSKSDSEGNLRNWWSESDMANFKELQDKLGGQFAQICPLDEGKTCINPDLTMGENIGDLGGLSLAYRAYQLSLEGKEAPVIDGFTGDQRFFMAWAQVWRSEMREELLRRYLVTDVHSPPRYRVNGIVRNFDEWHDAFGVKPDDALYLPPEERVRIW